MRTPSRVGAWPWRPATGTPGVGSGQRDAEVLREAADRFFPAGYRLLSLGRSTGYSGSAFARVDAEGGSWCLRRWPRRVAARRLRFVHRALAASRHGGFAGVPVLVRTHAGATIVRVRGALHDAQEWVAGAPLSGPVSGPPRVPNRVRAVPPAVLTELAGALAAFHASTEGLAAGEGMTAFPLATLLAEVGAAVDALARAPTPATRTADEMDLVARWFDSLPRALRLAERVLARHPGGASDAGTLCHGDLWPGHVFAAEGTFRGFVDFESIGFASPATDLAHLLLHFGGWDAQEEALTAYERVCALPPGAVACLPAAVALDAANEGAWALSALLGRLSKAQRGAHLANLRDLHGPLDAVLARYG